MANMIIIVDEFVWAAVTKCNQLGSSNNKYLFSHSPGG